MRIMDREVPMAKLLMGLMEPELVERERGVDRLAGVGTIRVTALSTNLIVRTANPRALTPTAMVFVAAAMTATVAPALLMAQTLRPVPTVH